MSISRGLLLWSALAFCGVIVLGAMTWLTRGVLASEKSRALAEARADLEERTRLALWRMDAFGASLVLRENSGSTGGEPEVLLRFEKRPGGVPIPKGPGGEQQEILVARLTDLLANVSLPIEIAPQPVAVLPMLDNSFQRKTRSGDDLRKDTNYQTNSNISEWTQRAKVVSQALENAPRDAAQEVAPVQMRPYWLGGELFLLGKDGTGGTQGVWFDSQVLQNKLLGEIVDLLPDARLVPSARVSEDGFSLASFPFRLVRNETFVAPALTTNRALVTGWIAVLAALLTTCLLVHGVMRLSERRASFVSAVTHELRTPLTTFRLYSDMLESGAVKPEKRGEYLRVLSREADRLSHLVENVLSFSKVVRGSARSTVRETNITDLLEPMRERLEARLATAGLTLEMKVGSDAELRADAAAVEHILFNLVDNSAKYAAGGDPPRVEIECEIVPRGVEIRVRDHGPGIPVSERRRIFRAFHKSAREAAESRPGVGLGLALSRRLAKSLGGTLECADAEDGALFVLWLPRS